jgi:transcriptional regulator with XRE-family HTH domain
MTEATLGDRLYQARLSAGYTRSTLAELADVHEDTIVNYETNVTQRPQEAVALRIAKVLRVNPLWLLTGRGAIDGAEP